MKGVKRRTKREIVCKREGNEGRKKKEGMKDGKNKVGKRESKTEKTWKLE